MMTRIITGACLVARLGLFGFVYGLDLRIHV